VVQEEVRLSIRDLRVNDDAGLLAVDVAALDVRAGEIVGVAGVSGNGQRELMEALTGQRAAESGTVLVHGEPFRPRRGEMARHRVFSLPEEPLRNACVPGMSVAENMALRDFDRAPLASGPWLRRGRMIGAARARIAEYRVKTRGPHAAIRTLSGGNVQRAVLSRELSADVSLLLVANPVFGLDFAAVADIHARILAARDAGAAVLLVSEDLDDLLELADRIVVMFDGRLVHETTRAAADVGVIGRSMAGHHG
jgi:simple sugar transport system ATP-binding protein